MRSCGTDCQTRSVSPSCSPILWKMPAAPSQPSLSWIATTPLDAREPQAVAGRVHELVLARHREAGAELPCRLLAQDAGRLAGSVPLDDASLHLQVAVGERERGGIEPERVVVLRPEQRRSVSGRRVESLLRRLRVPLGRSPARPADPAPVARMAPDALERLLEPRHALEPHVALRERPRRKVDVRVREPGHDTPPTEVDDVRCGEDGLVNPHAAGDPIPGDGERTRRGQRRIHGADDAVLQDHARRL